MNAWYRALGRVTRRARRLDNLTPGTPEWHAAMALLFEACRVANSLAPVYRARR